VDLVSQQAEQRIVSLPPVFCCWLEHCYPERQVSSSVAAANRRAMRLTAYRSTGSARHQAAALATGLPTISAVI